MVCNVSDDGTIYKCIWSKVLLTLIFLNMSSDSDNSLNKSTDSDNSSNENTDLSHSDLSHVLSDTDSDLYCHKRLLPSLTLVTSCIKEKSYWNLATHHLRREIRNHCSRKILWIKSV